MCGKKTAVGLLLVLLVGATVGWIERARLESWYYLRGLSRASEAERDVWIERVAGLGEPAVEGLLDCLDGADDRACRNAAAALDHLARTWGEGDPRTADLASHEAKKHAALAPFVAAALKRKTWMRPLADSEIPVVQASVKAAQVSGRV